MGHMGHMDHIHGEQLIKLRCDAREIDIIIPNYTHGLQFYHLMNLMVLRSPAPIFPFPASITYRILIHLFMVIYDYLWLFITPLRQEIYLLHLGNHPDVRSFHGVSAPEIHGDLARHEHQELLASMGISLRGRWWCSHWLWEGRTSKRIDHVDMFIVYICLYNSDLILIVVWTGSESLKDSERLISDVGFGAFPVRLNVVFQS